MVEAHKFDGMVLVGSCDKIVPGIMMAAALLDIPTIFINGGPMLPGSFEGKELTVSRGLKTMFGAIMFGLPEETVKEISNHVCPEPDPVRVCTRLTLWDVYVKPLEWRFHSHPRFQPLTQEG